MQTISGNDAIARMRQLKDNPLAFFQLTHLTYNSTNNSTSGMRHVDRCQLRTALPDDAFENTLADLFLPYLDLSMPKARQNRMCRKKLIRFVAFPPDYTMLKVNWFNTDAI